VAQELTHRGVTEMSCLAGVAAGLQHFNKQLAGREAWVVDGCPLECAAEIFRKQDRAITHHVRLDHHGVKKQTGLPRDLTVAELADSVLARHEATREAQVA
jgi:uncharacterized metal-binding protein